MRLLKTDRRKGTKLSRANVSPSAAGGRGIVPICATKCNAMAAASSTLVWTRVGLAGGLTRGRRRRHLLQEVRAMKLYGYFRSSAAFRVRIALNLKGLRYEQSFIHLRKNEQRGAAYLELNPQGLVPTLEDDGELVTQSLAIIEYLDETTPEPALLPGHPVARARVRSLAMAIACDIHPIDNLRVLRYLAKPLGHGDKDVESWFNPVSYTHLTLPTIYSV